jgi:F0F1-type ATP synthase membrane subunit c/vacuolar-type H+-ATPase subunit K
MIVGSIAGIGAGLAAIGAGIGIAGISNSIIYSCLDECNIIIYTKY